MHGLTGGGWKRGNLRHRASPLPSQSEPDNSNVHTFSDEQGRLALADSVIVNDRSCWGPKVREARLCVPHLLGGREYIEGEDPTLHANLTQTAQ
jgi:hypothetical protein